MNRNKTIGALILAATFSTAAATPFMAASLGAVMPPEADTPVVSLKDINTVGHKGSRHNVAPIGPMGEIRNDIPKSFFQPGYNPVVKECKQKVLVLMLNMTNDPFKAEHTEQYYYDCLFGPATDSVKNFVINQSGGKVQIQPADTKNTALPGVIKIDVNAADYGTVGAEDFEKHQQIMKDALNKVKDQVDWAAIDINGDKKFEEPFFIDEEGKEEEIVVMAMISGATKVGNYSEEGKVKSWPHTSYFEHTLGEYTFSNSMIMASEFAEADIVSQTTLSHEYLHNLNARDMYLDEDSIGPWSTMCTTYGRRRGENRTSPTPLDPVHRMYMGWAEPKEIKLSKNDVEIPFNKNEVPYIQDPKNPDVFYLLDYRDLSDENQKALNFFNVNNDGLLVWKLNQTEAERDWYFGPTNDLPDWYVNSKGPRTAMSVLVKGPGPTSYENSYINVGTGCNVGEGIQVLVQDKKMILKGSELAPDPQEETLTIEVADKTVEAGSQVNPLEGVVVKNSKGEVVQAELSLVASNLKPNEPGEYTVTVKATYNGATVEKSYKITVVAKPAQQQPPVITASDRTITVGDSFNPKEGVTAKDSEGNDLTQEVQIVSNSVQVDTAGVYQIVFEVTDKNGLKATKTITVTVEEAAKPGPGEGEGDNKPGGEGDQKPDPTPDEGEGDNKPGGEGDQKPDPTPDEGEDQKPGEEQKPGGEEQKPGGEDHKPGGDQKPDPTPGEGDNKPGGDQQKPGEGDNKPGGDQQKPGGGDNKPGNTPGATRDSVPPTIKGAEDVVIQAGSKFNILDGITAVDNDGSTSEVQYMPTNFDPAKPGRYKITYYTFDKAGNMAYHERLVEVTGNAASGADKVAPELKLFDTSFSLPKGHHINPLVFVTATDNVDGDVSRKVRIVGEAPDLSVPGKYTVKVSVTDSSGNSKEAEMNFNIRDGKLAIFAPTITMNEGEQFQAKSGMTAISSTGADITDKVTVDTSKLDSTKPGSYTVSYTVKDVDGKELTVDRKVNVVDKDQKINMPSIKFSVNAFKKGVKFDDMTGVVSEDRVKVVSGSVDTSTTGIYHIVYEVTNTDGNTIQVVRRVAVLPEDLKSSAPNVFAFNSRVKQGSKFDPLANMLVVDKEDGVLNHKLLVEKNDVDASKVGSYSVKYAVIDNDANATSYTANVEVISDLQDPSQLPAPDNGDGVGGNSNGDSRPTIKPSDIPQHVVSGSLPKTGAAAVANFTALVSALGAAFTAFLRKFK